MATKRPASQQLSGQPHLKRRETGNDSPRLSGASTPVSTNASSDPKACLNALLSITAALATAEVELSVLQSEHTQANEDVIDAKKKKNFLSYLEIKQRFALQKLTQLRQCQDKVDALQGKKGILSESFIVSLKPNEDDLISKITKHLEGDLDTKIRNVTASFEIQINLQIVKHQSEIAQLHNSNTARQFSDVTQDIKKLRDDLTRLSEEHESRYGTVHKVLRETNSDTARLATMIETLEKELRSYRPALNSLATVMKTLPERTMKVEANVRLILEDISQHAAQLQSLQLQGQAKDPVTTSNSPETQTRLEELQQHVRSLDKQVGEMRDQIEISRTALDLFNGVKKDEVNVPGVLARLDKTEAHLDSIETLKIKVSALDSLQNDIEDVFEELKKNEADLLTRIKSIEDRNDASTVDGNVKVEIEFLNSRIQEQARRIDTCSSEVSHLAADHLNAGHAQVAICQEHVRKMETTITSLRQDVKADMVKKEEFEALQAEAKTIKRDANHHVVTFGAVQQAVQHLEARVNNTTTEHISSMLDRWLWDHGQKGLRNLFAPIKVVAEIEALSSENDNRVKDAAVLRAHVDKIDQHLKTAFEKVKTHIEQLPQVDNITELPQKIAELSSSVDDLRIRTINLPKLEAETKRLGHQLTQTSQSDERIKRVEEQMSGLGKKVDDSLDRYRENIQVIEAIKRTSTQIRVELSTTKTNHEDRRQADLRNLETRREADLKNLENRRKADLVAVTDQIKQIDKEYKTIQENIQKHSDYLKASLSENEKVVAQLNESISSFKDDYNELTTNFDKRIGPVEAAQLKTVSRENLDKLSARVEELITFKKSIEVKQDQATTAIAATIPAGPRASMSALSIRGAALRDQASQRASVPASTARSPANGNHNAQGPFLSTPTPRQTTALHSQRPSTPTTTVGKSANTTSSSAKNGSFPPRTKRETTAVSSNRLDSGSSTPGPSTLGSSKLARKQRKEEKRKTAQEKRKDMAVHDLTNAASDDDNGEDPLSASATRYREATEEL